MEHTIKPLFSMLGCVWNEECQKIFPISYLSGDDVIFSSTISPFLSSQVYNYLKGTYFLFIPPPFKVLNKIDKNKTKNQSFRFFEKINNIGKLLARLTKRKKREYSTKIRNESEVMTTNFAEVKRIVRECCDQL